MRHSRTLADVTELPPWAAERYRRAGGELSSPRTRTPEIPPIPPHRPASPLSCGTHPSRGGGVGGAILFSSCDRYAASTLLAKVGTVRRGRGRRRSRAHSPSDLRYVARKRNLTITEAAELTGLSRKAIARRVERGSVRSVLRSGRRLVPRSELA